MYCFAVEKRIGICDVDWNERFQKSFRYQYFPAKKISCCANSI